MSKKEAIVSVLTQLATVVTTTQDGNASTMNAMVFNNQIENKKDGKGYVYQTPASFLETEFSEGMPIGGNATSHEVIFRILVEHENYNEDGSFDKDLIIYDIVDAVHRVMNGFKPTNCSPMYQNGSISDYSHDNIYLFKLEYKSHFVDLVSTDQDSDMGFITETLVDPSLDMNETIYIGAIPDGGGGTIYTVNGVQITITGSNVHQWWTGSGVPSTVGYNGDYYRDSDNQDVYYKEAGTWALVGNLLGGGGGSGMLRQIIAISGDTTAGADASTDYVYLLSGNCNLSLPTAVSNTNRYTVIKVGTGTNNVIFTGGQTANGSATISLVKQYEALDFISNNSNWNIS